MVHVMGVNAGCFKKHYFLQPLREDGTLISVGLFPTFGPDYTVCFCVSFIYLAGERRSIQGPGKCLIFPSAVLQLHCCLSMFFFAPYCTEQQLFGRGDKSLPDGSISILSFHCFSKFEEC